jgi:hypothetical protein
MMTGCFYTLQTGSCVLNDIFVSRMVLIRGLLNFIIKVYPIQLFLGLIFPVKQDILAGNFKDRQIGVETKTKKII